MDIHTENYKRALEKLVSYNKNLYLPGRESESEEISDIIKTKLKKRHSRRKPDTHAGAIYIFGHSGAGKTTVVNHVSERLSRRKNSIQESNTVHIDCIHFPRLERVYSEILSKLTKESCSPDEARERLSWILGEGDFKLIIIDQLEIFSPKRNLEVIHSLNDWANRPESRLILILISRNDIYQRRFSKEFRALIGKFDKKIHFKRYNEDHLMEILNARLGIDLVEKIFEPSSLKLATSRTANEGGDARKFLTICRLAIRLAMDQGSSQVQPSHIHKSGWNNTYQIAYHYIQTACPLQIMILRCIVIGAKIDGKDHVTALATWTRLVHMLKNLTKKENYYSCFNQYWYIYQLQCLEGSQIISIHGDGPWLEKQLYIRNPTEIYEMISSVKSGTSATSTSDSQSEVASTRDRAALSIRYK